MGRLKRRRNVARDRFVRRQAAPYYCGGCGDLTNGCRSASGERYGCCGDCCERATAIEIEFGRGCDGGPIDRGPFFSMVDTNNEAGRVEAATFDAHAEGWRGRRLVEVSYESVNPFTGEVTEYTRQVMKREVGDG